MEHAWIEAGDAVDTTLFRQDPVPEILNTGADACDRANTGNDRASSAHAATLSALASRSTRLEYRNAPQPLPRGSDRVHAPKNECSGNAAGSSATTPSLQLFRRSPFSARA